MAGWPFLNVKGLAEKDVGNTESQVERRQSGLFRAFRRGRRAALFRRGRLDQRGILSGAMRCR